MLFQLLFLWIFMTFTPGFIPLVYCSHVDHDERVITIDETGTSSAECCVFGKCYCSNLSLALEHIQSNATIRMISNMSFKGATWLEGTNDTAVSLKAFENIFDKYEVVWLQEFMLQFTLTITSCLNNLYGPAQMFLCCDDHRCDERYEYIFDSTHHTVTMISNDTIASCPGSKEHKFQLVATANVNGTLSMHSQIDIKSVLSNGSEENCDDIAHVFDSQCLPLSCNLTNPPKGIKCFKDGYFTVIPGYWFSNGFTKFVKYCPQGHCTDTFHLYHRIHDHGVNCSKTGTCPKSDDQCTHNWTGLACGECNKDNCIIHDSTSCVSSDKHTLKNFSGIIVFFFVSLLYWIIVISFIFVLLFKFDITAGHAYGIIFYYSMLEQTVNASYAGTDNNLNSPNIIRFLTILSSIGNMKPPFKLLKLCFWEDAKMIDHMVLTYIHPVIVTSLIVTTVLLSRNFVMVARTVGRFVNSKSICILLIFSYNSVSYTSVQLFRLLKVYNCEDVPESMSCTIYGLTSLRFYLSPNVKYFDPSDEYFIYTIMYSIIALIFGLIMGIGLPLFLVFQQYLTRYCNINFTSIKPIMDQFKGCYKEEYHWFAAYYLLCRQIMYIVSISASDATFPMMLTVYILIMMVHIWLQPYKQRKLNVLDSSILVTLMLVFIGEHNSYGSTVALWIIPLVLFINCVAFPSMFKYLLIPISCVGIVIFTVYIASHDHGSFTQFEYDDYNMSYDYDYFIYDYYVDSETSIFTAVINMMILCVSGLVFLAFFIHILRYLCRAVIRKCRKPQYRLVNEQNEDSDEDSDSNDVI